MDEGCNLSTDLGPIFENDIRTFLTKVGFEDVPKPDEKLILGGQEIDAFGRDGAFYVVVDAKTKTSLKKRGRNVRSYLSIINGYMKEVIDAIKDKYQDKYGYRGTVFIFWTKNLEINESHKNRAKELKVALRDCFDLKYYKEAYNILANKKVIRNCLLKDLQLQLSELNVFTLGHSINAKAIQTAYGSKTLYVFPIEVGSLLDFAYVFRIETNSILGSSYQRLLKKNKIKSIKTYLKAGGYFPNNLIAISEEKLTFTPDKGESSESAFTHGTLQLPDKPCYLEILDGQHRLYGYSELPDRHNHCLWVTIIEGLNEVDRAKLFVKINKTQTPVPSDILWDLYRVTEPKERGEISNFIYTLNEESPFKDVITLPRIRSLNAYLSFSNFCLSLGQRSQVHPKFGNDPNLINAIRAYYEKIRADTIIQTDWRRSITNKGKKGFILTNNSISVTLRLLKKILEKTGIPSNNKIEAWKNNLDPWIIPAIRAYLQEHIDPTDDGTDPFNLLRRALTSEGARKAAADEIWKKSPMSKATFKATC